MGLMNKVVLIILTAALSSCQSTTPETFQGTPQTLKNGDMLSRYPSIQERNFRIWQRNQTDISGITAFKSLGPCPDMHGH